jgi:hypothetical protein
MVLGFGMKDILVVDSQHVFDVFWDGDVRVFENTRSGVSK